MHWNPSSPPTRRVRRRVFLAALALFLLPGLCPGEVLANGQSDQDRRIRDIIQNSSATVRDTRGNVIAELKDGVPRQVRSDNFSSTVKDVGTAIRDGQLNLHGDHMNLVYNLQMELSSQPANDTTHNSLRGAGGNADALADWLFFTLPLDNDKFLRNLATRVKFRVEFLNGESKKSKVPVSNAHITMTTNPRLKSKLLFTKGIARTYGSEYGMGYGGCQAQETLNGGCNGHGGGKVRIDMALGGSNTNPETGEFMGLACIFGTARPNEMVNVMAFSAFGMTGGQTVWADSLGNWRADFDYLSPGHNLFGAIRGLGAPYVTQALTGGCDYNVCMATQGLTGCDCGCDYQVCEATAGLGGCDCSPKMMGKAAMIELGLLRDEVRFQVR